MVINPLSVHNAAGIIKMDALKMPALTQTIALFLTQSWDLKAGFLTLIFCKCEQTRVKL